MRRAIVCLAVVVMLASGCMTLGGVSESSIIRAKNKVAPALVHISPVKNVFTGGKREEVVAIGSGFIISADGYVVTNEHVAGKASFVRCVLSTKEEVEAEVVGVDPAIDIAVLKLKAPGVLPFVKMGSSNELQTGQIVLALGSPHGLSRSVSMGIISVTDRYLNDPNDTRALYNTFIQTDAAINQGNSGGPLVNLKGEVVGVNARKLSDAENVGFAIPVDIVRESVDQIIASGHVTRSTIGVALQEMLSKTDDPAVHGVVVGDVDPLGPAAEAGVHAGDVITMINGEPAHARFEEDLPGIRKRIAALPIGTAATLHVLRGEEEQDISVTPEESNDNLLDEVEFTEWGFTAASLTPAIVRRAELTEKKGIIVVGVEPGSVSANALLQRGDIIQKLDDTEIPDLVQFRKSYDQSVAEKKRLVMLVVRRGAITRYVLIKQDGSAGPGSEIQSEAPMAAPGIEGNQHHEE